jgi:two-component system nitrogen regulation sensor histidine kinase NtrY
MQNRWLNLLLALLFLLLIALGWHLFVYAQTPTATSLILLIIKPINILLLVTLFFIIARSAVKIWLNQKRQDVGYRLRTKLVLAILPLTLLPALLIFFLASRFLDDTLLNLFDTNLGNVIRNAEGLRLDYLEDIERLHLGHGPTVAKLENEEQVQGYLDKHGLQAVEFYRDDQLAMRVFSSDFPIAEMYRVEETAQVPLSVAKQIYDDGYVVIRFPFLSNDLSVHFIYTKDTPFTQRFSFIQDTFTYLERSRDTKERVQDINQGILLIATLAVIFAGIWTGMTFAQRYIRAFNKLIHGAERVGMGRFEEPIDLKTGDEIEDVGKAFNSMMQTLAASQADLRNKAEALQNLNDELKGQIEFSQAILNHINAGIVTVSPQGNISAVNPAAKDLFDIEREPIGEPLESLFEDAKYQPLADHWLGHTQSNFKSMFDQLEFADPGGRTSQFVAVAIVALIADGNRFGSLMVLEDLTQLIHAQKLAAWREVAKRIAHEIKNPLTPIQLSVQRIKRKADKGAPDLEKAIFSTYETVMAETEILKNLLSEFSTFANLPQANKEACDFTTLVKNLRNSYRDILEHVEVKAEIAPGNHIAQADQGQMHQVLTNLIQNAAQACGEGDQIILSLNSNNDQLVLKVCDTGPGIPDSEKPKVFVPYYSKSPKGTGLGLAIVKRIIEDHGGSIEVEDCKPKGTAFIIHLPIQSN